MDLELTTPALLFPAISLLLLAYTNRFLTVAGLIRSLHERYTQQPDDKIIEQLRNLRYRVDLIRRMQGYGVMSLLLCVVCMFVLFAGQMLIGQITFGISLILMMISLALSVREIHVSVEALDVQITDIEAKLGERSARAPGIGGRLGL